MYYKAATSGKIFSNRRLSILDDIFGHGAFKSLVEKGTLAPIEKPSVIDLLKNDQMYEAALLYREIHKGSTIKESFDMVKRIQSDMKRRMTK